MAKYWIYINDKVMGPYELDQLIRVPGFSRQTMVSVDGGPEGRWISPAEIPDLARIFQKADELHDAPIPTPRPAPKINRPRMPAKLTPVPPPVEPKANKWIALWWVLGAAAVGLGGLFWHQSDQARSLLREQQAAQRFIETYRLPSRSAYATIQHFLQQKHQAARWEFERSPTGLPMVTLSWWPAGEEPGSVPLHTFEVNLAVKSLRGVNTAAARLLSEGFHSPPAVVKAAAPAPAKKSPGDHFPSAINDRREAFENGDFSAVWQSFSKRRLAEMKQAGISEDGFVRMQKLTYRSGPTPQQKILKTTSDSNHERLVLIRQTQSKHPDIYIKQRWVWEDEHWRMDEEEKKVASAADAKPDDEPVRTAAEPAAPSAAPAPKMPNLPGLSDPSSAR